MSPRARSSDEESRPVYQEVDSGRHDWEQTVKPDKDMLDGISRTVYDRLVKASQDELIYPDPSDGNTILNLATLQRMLLFHLQVKIVKGAGELANRKFAKGNPLDSLKTPMAEYVQAVRDWELMANYRSKAYGDMSWDPFLIRSKGNLISEQMEAHLPTSQGDYSKTTLETELGTFYQRSFMVKHRSSRALFWRCAAALFGGITLVGPMLLMVLHSDKTTNLSTTSVAVFLFAMFVAYFSEAPPEILVSVVAAYAAVLVVFVGTVQSDST